MKSKKILSIIIVLTIFLLVGLMYFLKRQQLTNKKTETVSEESSKFEDVKADLNGDGKQETLRLTYTDTLGKVVSLATLDQGGKEIGRLPDSMPISVPFSESGKVYNPIADEKRQFISFDFPVGPHSSETMFFGLKEKTKKVLPVCLTKAEDFKGEESCLFWSGEVDELLVRDIDNDGYLEVVEIVDEYPRYGPITTDTEKTVEETFKDSGEKAVGQAKEIIEREQGGRGRKCIWAIYRFNNNEAYFEEQTGSNYERYFGFAKQYLQKNPNYPSLVKKGEMSKESVDYNEMVRKFWTHRDERV